jgi:cell division septum initiation protein DivIVA
LADVDELLDLIEHVKNDYEALARRVKRLERVVREEVTFDLPDDDDEDD